MLSYVPERKTDTDRWSQALIAVVIYNINRNAGHRILDANGDSGYDYLREVHAFVHNAIVWLIFNIVKVRWHPACSSRFFFSFFFLM